MTLSLAQTSFEWSPNTVDDSIRSQDSYASPDWRVSNLQAGALVNLGTGTNTSDVNYNEFTGRFGFVRNNFATISEISESDIVTGVVNPAIIRVITITGIASFLDSEGLSNVLPNILEGGFELWMSIENGGRNWAYNIPISLSEMFSSSNISIAVRQRLQVAPNSADTNDALEGVDFKLDGTSPAKMIGCQEGAVGVRKFWTWDRPSDRDTDLDEAVDAGLTVIEPFDADVIVPGGSDLSSCCFHPATGHYLLLSDTGSSVYQYDSLGTLIDTLAIVGMLKPEGICLHGDNLVVMGETDECRYYTYVAP